MGLTKSIGKNTLGGGQKMTVDLRTYNRSTHDLSYAWRSSIGVGTLVPCMKLLALPGDTFDINIDNKVLTHPTVGPLFGSYKLQVDIFTVPFRLYIAALHNNALNVGMDMSKVKIPVYTVEQRAGTENLPKELKYSTSCILTYLGNRGQEMRSLAPKSTGLIDQKFNAIPLLGYLDIFKNYYANKQESLFRYIGADPFLLINSLNLTTKPISTNINSEKVTGGVMNINIENGPKWDEINYNDIKLTFVRKVGTEDDYTKYETTYTLEELKKWFKYVISNKVLIMTYTESSVSTSEDYLYGKPTSWSIENISNILTEPLTDLDQLREDILGMGNEKYELKRDTKLGNNGPFEYIQHILGGNNTIYESSTAYNRSSAQCGLLLKTYQSDIFTNWINSEWIDGENGISAVTAISTEGNKFTIDQLNLSKKVYDMLNRIAVSGGTYQDWVETVYTSTWNMHTETPVYEGGMSAEIEFQEVVSNSATEKEPLGTLAGRGFSSGKKGGRLHIKVTEPCYIMGIVSITPRVDYCQGNDWDVTSLETMDDLHKPQLDSIGYQDLMQEQMNAYASRELAVGKQPSWINYMTNYNKTYGTFADEEGENEAFMVLNRYFDTKETGISDKKREIYNTSSYIDPSQYNYIFAETGTKSMNFWVQLGFAVEARRVMSASQIPNL